jgi:hypothetical protein
METMTGKPVYFAATQQQVNSEIIETFESAALWGSKVMIGTAALLFLAGFLAFIIWRAAD